jgi:hypothetical protein
MYQEAAYLSSIIRASTSPYDVQYIGRYIGDVYDKRSSVLAVKRQSHILGDVLDIFLLDSDHSARKEARSALYGLLGAWGPVLSREVWEIVAARCEMRDKPFICYGSEFEGMLGPMKMGQEVYGLLV